MIIKVAASGRDAPGLSRYLFGEGRHNEHVEQRVVAGSEPLVSEWSGGQLSLAEATHLGRVVESAWRLEHAEQFALAGSAEPRGGVPSAHRSKANTKGADHVMHVTMSLHPNDPDLTDEQWKQIADAYVDRMGFNEGGDKVACSWYAMRHGRSGRRLPTPGAGELAQGVLAEEPGGNDHIHLVVSLVRNDGRRADTWQSKIRSQEVRRQLEQELDFLTPLHDQGAEQPALSPYTQGEQRRAEKRAADAEKATTKGARKVMPEPDRVHLQRIVRGAAVASSTEAEWLRNAALAGADLRPRWQAGGREVVTGYSVSLTDVPDSIYLPASKLAPDLTLRSLRGRWAANETDQTRADALALWREEQSVTRPTAPAQDVELGQAAEHLAEATEQLRTVSPDDIAAWRAHTADVAGALSLISQAEADPAQARGTGAAADALARDSFGGRRGVVVGPGHGITRSPRSPALSTAIAARHINLALRAGSPDSTRGWLAVMLQLQRTVTAIRDAHEARGELVAAQRLAWDTAALTTVRDDGRSPVAVLPRPEDPSQPSVVDEEAVQAVRDSLGHTAASPTRPTATPLPGERGTEERLHRDRDQGPQQER